VDRLPVHAEADALEAVAPVPSEEPMTRRDALLLLVAAVVIAVLALIGRSASAPATSETAWRELERVDWA
jgi:hypothetical protein